MASKARAILEAVKLSTNAEPAQLHQFLVQHRTLKLDVLLRIVLTYLPETLEPSEYYHLLGYLSGKDDDRPTTTSSVEPRFSHDELTESEARKRVKQLRLLPLLSPHYNHSSTDIVDSDPFTKFLIHRAHRIETETGSLPLVSALVEPFLDHSACLRTWAISVLLPLLRLDYEYYQAKEPTYSLEAFENSSDNSVIEGLLSRAGGNEEKILGKDVARDLRGLVGPWTYGQNIRKRRKLDGVSRRRSSTTNTSFATGEDATSQGKVDGSWTPVNDWLLEFSMRDFPRVVDAFSQWDGPQDVDYGKWKSASTGSEGEFTISSTRSYAQTGLAIIYCNNTASQEVTEKSHAISQRVGSLMKLTSLPELPVINNSVVQSISDDYLQSLSPTQLLHNALLRSQNPVTTPSNTSLSLIHLILSFNHILNSLEQSKSCKVLFDLAMFASVSDQMAELRKMLHGLSSRVQNDESWHSSRQKLLWLRDWSRSKDQPHDNTSNIRCGIFSKIELSTMEIEILKAMLAGSNYNQAVKIYCKQDSPPLPLTEVEKVIVDVALACYDSASNGNRNRGGVRKASELLTAFRTFFPNSDSLRKIDALLKATHAMSYYSLTLQHGILFQPVNIRAHKDPMLLVGKILEQNPKSYTKLDDLQDIGQDLVAAGLGMATVDSDSVKHDSEELTRQALVARRRVISMAIEAALREDDFDTAYSYIVNRLSQTTDPHQKNLSASDDDISWRAAYKAGCYKTSNTSGPSNLRRLEQRMELLSQALLLAPAAALCDILEVWRHCEEELNVILTQEAEAEEKWDDRGDRQIPGQFTAHSSPAPQKSREPSRAAMNEEAPMGLFDVARGAAATLSKSAFPLRASQKPAGAGDPKTVHEKSLSKMGAGGSDSGSGTEAEGRVRKRDVVSNMVTGGLASGIGWVLGAPPARDHE